MDYYKKQKKYYENELQIIDDENYKDYLKRFTMKEENYLCDIYDYGNNYVLNCGIESLSAIERTVIFLCFKKCYTTAEISNMINIREQSVSRIKRRALGKLKMFMKGYDLNE